MVSLMQYFQTGSNATCKIILANVAASMFYAKALKSGWQDPAKNIDFEIVLKNGKQYFSSDTEVIVNDVSSVLRNKMF